MDIIQFADRYIGRYKKGTTELQAHKCPFCGREKGKFYINIETGFYFCHSGSCNARGNFERLKEKFGLKEEIEFKKKKIEIIKKSLIGFSKDDFVIFNSSFAIARVIFGKCSDSFSIIAIALEYPSIPTDLWLEGPKIISE